MSTEYVSFVKSEICEQVGKFDSSNLQTVLRSLQSFTGVVAECHVSLKQLNGVDGRIISKLIEFLQFTDSNADLDMKENIQYEALCCLSHIICREYESNCVENIIKNYSLISVLIKLLETTKSAKIKEETIFIVGELAQCFSNIRNLCLESIYVINELTENMLTNINKTDTINKVLIESELEFLLTILSTLSRLFYFSNPMPDLKYIYITLNLLIKISNIKHTNTDIEEALFFTLRRITSIENQEINQITFNKIIECKIIDKIKNRLMESSESHSGNNVYCLILNLIEWLNNKDIQILIDKDILKYIFDCNLFPYDERGLDFILNLTDRDSIRFIEYVIDYNGIYIATQCFSFNSESLHIYNESWISKCIAILNNIFKIGDDQLLFNEINIKILINKYIKNKIEKKLFENKISIPDVIVNIINEYVINDINKYVWMTYTCYNMDFQKVLHNLEKRNCSQKIVNQIQKCRKKYFIRTNEMWYHMKIVESLNTVTLKSSFSPVYIDLIG